MSCYFYQNKTDSLLWLMYPCVLYKQTTMQSTQWHVCGEKALSYIFGGQANVVQPIWGGARMKGAILKLSNKNLNAHIHI